MKNTRKPAFATAIGLVTLIGLIVLAAFLFAPGAPCKITVGGGCILTVPPALGIWSGRLRHKGKPMDWPESWQQWLGLFAAGLVLSAVFIAMDLSVRNAGFSAIFTVGAVAMTFISLPSALRAWLLERWGCLEAPVVANVAEEAARDAQASCNGGDRR